MQKPGRMRGPDGVVASGLFCLALVVVAGWSAPASAGAAQSYVGADRCKSCHPFEYQRWAAGPHARPHRSLTKEQFADAKCNNCHTMLPGETDKRFVAVQCERCHGPGKYYHPEYVMKDQELARAVGLVDPKLEHCTACHTEGTPSIRPFDYARMWAEIDHGADARKRWESARGNATASKP